MKAKLIKNPINEYHLIVEKVPEFCYITEPLTGGYAIASSCKTELFKLSLKNCQAIERGFDLVELFDKVDNRIDYHEFDFTSFRLGAEAILDLMGHKKFSRGDIAYIMSMMQIYHGLSFDEAITKFESLQQKEWNVEIEMETIASGSITVVDHSKNSFEVVSETSLHPKEKRPKLDENGCLILKRI